jgi:glycosyltransferase involved in cell wall biosynthesis
MNNSAPIRVAFVISGLEVGGAESVLLRIVPRLTPHIEPEVISLTTVGPIGEQLQDLGVPVHALGMPASIMSITHLPNLVGRIRALAPDVVQTVMYHADLLGGIAARVAKVPAVAWSIHNSAGRLDAMKRSTRITISACAYTSSRIPDRIMCCSETARRNHIALGYDASRFDVIPNGFDLDVWRPDPSVRRAVRAELGFEPDVPLVGLFARLDPQKDHAGFFEAAGRLHRIRPDVRFVLAGSGVTDSDPQLSEWARRAGVTDVVRMLGLRDDLRRLVPSLDLAVLTSIGEAFPNAVGEAMACGIPCVVTDVGDAAAMVGDTGRIVPPNDPESAAAAWAQVLGLTPEARFALGAAARERVSKLYEMSAIARRYRQFYETLKSRSDPGRGA